MDFQNKKIIAFDMDGTLTESKADLDSEMARLIRQLLQKKLVAVMGGASFVQFQKQFLNILNATSAELKNLLIFATSAAAFYRYDGIKWNNVYEKSLTTEDEIKIKIAFEEALREINYKKPEKQYGEIIQNLGTQVTFSALGQAAPLSEKQEWHDNSDCREAIRIALENLIPEFEVRIGGLTSMNVTKKGIDKAYGIMQMERLLKIPKENIIFIGDALYVGGNDYPVKRAGVETIQVSGPEDTKQIIKSIIND